LSNPQPHLDNSVKGVREYLEHLTETGLVESVWLGGSRSPKSPKNSREDSDWDLQLITGTEKKELPQPADFGFYIDLFIFDKPSKYAVQLWPIDEMRILQ